MPRINTIGDFDWSFPYPEQKTGPFGDFTHLRFRLQFDLEAWEARNMHLLRLINEEVVYDDKGDNVSPGSLPLNHQVLEEDTKVIPSVVREIGRLLAGHNDVRGVVVHSKFLGAEDFSYTVGWCGLVISKPTGLVTTFENKINKWVKDCSLDKGTVPVLDNTTLQIGVTVCSCAGKEAELVERMVLRLRRITGKKIEWYRSGYGEDSYLRAQQFRKVDGLAYVKTREKKDVERIKKAIQEITPNIFYIHT